MDIMIDKQFQVNKDKAITTICKIEDELNSLQPLILNDLSLEHTLFIVIDMINGFAKHGNLASDRVKDLIPKISELLSNKKDLKKIFICDAHSEKSIEFQSYPLHALCETEESQIVDELLPYLDDKTIVLHKNSTNAMASKGLTLYLEEHNEIDNFILIGDCTDICILQCALGLKSHFNELNLSKRVIVPYAYVDTYDLDVNNHYGDLMNLFALYNMKLNGIEVYKGIDL